MDLEASRLKILLNIVVASFALYGISERNYQSVETSFFEKAVITIFSPIQGGITNARTRLDSFFDHYVDLVGVSKENEALNKKIDELENQLTLTHELARENKRLKTLLEFGEDLPYKKVLAQIVGWDSSSKNKVMRINKGKMHGIKPLSIVVTAKGLVGYVFRSTKRYSDILTLLDQNLRVDAIVDRTRSHGLIEGFSDSKCIMKYVNRTEPVTMNDKVLTSGLSRIFPKGFLIGRISKIERESYGITQFIEVTPAVDFQKLEEVIVLLAADSASKEEELKELDTLGSKDQL